MLIRFFLGFVRHVLAFSGPFRSHFSVLMIILFTCVQMASGAPLFESDVDLFISLSRPLHLQAPIGNAPAHDLNVFMDEFTFLPLLVVAMLMSIVPDASRLRRLLR